MKNKLSDEVLIEEIWGIKSKKEKTNNSLESEISIGSIKKFLYTNPFYVLSALILLIAQSIAFDTGNITLNNLIPLGIIVGFTALLAGTSIFIVRWGKVWDDARSILVVVLALLFVLSISTDGLLLDKGFLPKLYQIGGLFFAIGVIESIRRSLNIVCPKYFIGAYYISLALFFGYSIFLSELVLRNTDNITPALWGILAFPVIMSLAFLLFLPVAQQGNNYSHSSNTPWEAPYLPWIAFFVLFGMTFFRIYLFTISFHSAGGQGKLGGYEDLVSGFSWYMLLPVIMTSLVLLVEYSKATGKKVSIVALAVPILISIGSIVGENDFSDLQEAYATLIFKYFSPTVLVLGLSIIFFLYYWLRNMEYGVIGLYALMFAFILHLEANSLAGWICFFIVLLITSAIIVRHKSTLTIVLGVIVIIEYLWHLMQNYNLIINPKMFWVGIGLVMVFYSCFFVKDKLAKIIKERLPFINLVFFAISAIFVCTNVLSSGNKIIFYGLFLLLFASLNIAGFVFDKGWKKYVLLFGYFLVVLSFFGIIFFEKINSKKQIIALLSAMVVFLIGLAISIYKGYKIRKQLNS